MTIVPIEDAELDVCGGCGGLWVDWFDGEVRAVALQAISQDYVGRPSDPSSMHNEASAIGACPRCNQQLVDERYVTPVSGSRGSAEGGTRDVLDDKDPKKRADTGAHLLRCESCAGAFVSRAAAEQLSTLPKEETSPPPSESPKVLEPLPWQRFMAVVRRIFGGS